MILVIDANIIFSVLINPKGVVGQKFVELSSETIFIAPVFYRQKSKITRKELQKSPGSQLRPLMY
ncbi:MAG: hypothetical protein V4722_16370 [Bacteroidota bacterium]